MTYNPLIDAYIEKANPFAQPILLHLRELVHEVCMDVEEKVKWGMPFFDYKGPMCMMAAFKQHCTFGFWKYTLMKDLNISTNVETIHGNLGKILNMKDLPSDKKMKALIKKAMQINDDGLKIIKANPAPQKVVEVPANVMTAIKKNKLALATFTAFSPSHKREYINWITEAKTEATKEKRITQMIEWLEEGKDRNWKYRK